MEKAGNILKNFLKDKNISEGRVYSNFFRSWEFFVGQKLFGHTKILDIADGVLYVEVDHPGWLQLIQLKENQILKKIKKQYPVFKIKSVKYRVKLKEYKDIEPETIIEEPLVEPDENNTDLKNVKNHELRNILNKLYKSVINR